MLRIASCPSASPGAPFTYSAQCFRKIPQVTTPCSCASAMGQHHDQHVHQYRLLSCLSKLWDLRGAQTGFENFRRACRACQRTPAQQLLRSSRAAHLPEPGGARPRHSAGAGGGGRGGGAAVGVGRGGVPRGEVEAVRERRLIGRLPLQPAQRGGAARQGHLHSPAAAQPIKHQHLILHAAHFTCMQAARHVW